MSKESFEGEEKRKICQLVQVILAAPFHFFFFSLLTFSFSFLPSTTVPYLMSESKGQQRNGLEDGDDGKVSKS